MQGRGQGRSGRLPLQVVRGNVAAGGGPGLAAGETAAHHRDRRTRSQKPRTRRHNRPLPLRLQAQPAYSPTAVPRGDPRQEHVARADGRGPEALRSDRPPVWPRPAARPRRRTPPSTGRRPVGGAHADGGSRPAIARSPSAPHPASPLARSPTPRGHRPRPSPRTSPRPAARSAHPGARPPPAPCRPRGVRRNPACAAPSSHSPPDHDS